MKQELEMPAFASDAKEAEWWDARAESTDAEMAEAISNRTAMNLHDFLRREGLMFDAQEVTVPVRADDVELAKAQASTRGVRYEDYLSLLVHEALQSKRATQS